MTGKPLAALPERTLSGRFAALLVPLLAVLLPDLAEAQPHCRDWQRYSFWEEAQAADVERCLAAGADPNAATSGGRTPLHRAAWHGHSETVAALLAAGADPDAAAGDGRTPLHEAARYGSAETVALLLAVGADPDAAASDGRTPLHLAAVDGNSETVAALVAAGADPDAAAGDGRTPLHEAARAAGGSRLSTDPQDPFARGSQIWQCRDGCGASGGRCRSEGKGQ